jgi:integrase
MTGKELDLVAGGRDLAADAQRLTAGERFTEADYELMERGVAKNTRRRLRDAWKVILKFTSDHGYIECPMPVETCVKMIDWCWTQTGRYGQPYSPQSVKSMLWALTKAHNVARRPDGIRGYVSPVKSEEVRRAFRGYRQKYVAKKYRSDMASPISPDEAVAMIRTVDTRSPQGLRDALAIAFLYDGGFRAGEIVVSDEDRPGIRWEDVELRAEVTWEAVDWRRPEAIRLFGPDDAGGVLRRVDHLVVHVPMSKTDQEGYGDEVLLYAHPREFAFNCPVRLFIAWQKLLREQGHARRGTMLRIVLHGNKAPADGRPKKGTLTEQPMAYPGLAYAFARWVRDAGLQDPEGFLRHLVLHGMRAGAAEAAAERDADTPELNRHFRWSQFGTTAQRYAARGRKRKQNPAMRVWGQRDAAE